MLRENETYRYLGIWEVDINKQVKMKEKIKKRVSLVNEDSSQNQVI